MWDLNQTNFVFHIEQQNYQNKNPTKNSTTSESTHQLQKVGTFIFKISPLNFLTTDETRH